TVLGSLGILPESIDDPGLGLLEELGVVNPGEVEALLPYDGLLLAKQPHLRGDGTDSPLSPRLGNRIPNLLLNLKEGARLGCGFHLVESDIDQLPEEPGLKEI